VHPELRSEAYWDRVAACYAALYDNEWSHFEDSILRSDLRTLLSQVCGKRVLDICCGTGLGYDLLGGAAADVEYVGVDISSAMLKQFTERCPMVTVVQGSAEFLDRWFPQAQFDLVIAINVSASFLVDRRRMISEVFRLLAPGGIAHLSFLNRHSLRRLLHGSFKEHERYRTRGDSEANGYVWARTVSRKQLLHELSAAGFVQIQSSYRSVLGGVWETRRSVQVERVLSCVVPGLGHSLVVTGKHPRSPR
jgi:ubiquinone/menaquinone biosynthesis C-methylase UbiE